MGKQRKVVKDFSRGFKNCQKSFDIRETMVVTRKVRPKKDEPSTSEAVEYGDEEILPETEEPLSDAADDPGEAVEESIDIKAELAQSEPEDSRPEGKRQDL